MVDGGSTESGEAPSRQLLSTSATLCTQESSDDERRTLTRGSDPAVTRGGRQQDLPARDTCLHFPIGIHVHPITNEGVDGLYSKEV